MVFTLETTDPFTAIDLVEPPDNFLWLIKKGETSLGGERGIKEDFLIQDAIGEDCCFIYKIITHRP